MTTLDEIRGRWERGEGWPPGVHYNVTAEQDVKFLLDLIARHDAEREQGECPAPLEFLANWGEVADGNTAH